LIAQQILKISRLAAYSLPPKLLVCEKPDGSGTIVAYHLPSSIMALPGADSDPELQRRLEELDVKVEKLAESITAT